MVSLGSPTCLSHTGSPSPTATQKTTADDVHLSARAGRIKQREEALGLTKGVFAQGSFEKTWG